MVRSFDFFSGKTENFRQKIRYASRLETVSVIKIVTENDRVRYGTVRHGIVDKIGLPTVSQNFSIAMRLSRIDLKLLILD
jgi:hypothetical protein